MLKLIWFLLVGRRCTHPWKVVVERELASRAEELAKYGEKLSTWRQPHDLMQAATKKVIVVMTCEKCGDIVTKEFSNAA